MGLYATRCATLHTWLIMGSRVPRYSVDAGAGCSRDIKIGRAGGAAYEGGGVSLFLEGELEVGELKVFGGLGCERAVHANGLTEVGRYHLLVVGASAEHSHEVEGCGVGIVDGSESALGLGVVLGENLGECGVVALGFAECAGGGGVVTVLQVVDAECIVKFLDACGRAEVLVGLGIVLVEELDKAEVHLGFSACGSDGCSFLEVGGGVAVVAGYILCEAEVVPRAIVVGVEFGGLGVDSLAACVVVGEGSGVEDFVNLQCLGVAVDEAADLCVAAADNVHTGRDARVAELGQDDVGELLEDVGEVADFAFALLGVLIHAEYAEDKLLVLDVALRYEFLEALPVLGGELRGEFAEFRDLVLLELAAHVGVGVGLALFGEVAVEVVAAVGGSVGGDVDFFDYAGCVLVGVEEFLLQFQHGVGLEFAGADVGLVDEEHDVGCVFLIDDTLEGIAGEGGGDACGIGEGCGGDDAVGYAYAGEDILLAALADVESELKHALRHIGGEVVGNGDGECAAAVVAHDRCVAAHFLTLEAVGLRGCLRAVVDQIGCNRNLGILDEEFGRHACGDRSGYFFAYYFEGVGVHCEIVGAELSELFAA